MPYPISIQMYTVRELTKTPDDYRKIVREIADIGYAAIEGGAPADMKAEEFERFVRDLGMHVSSLWGTPKPDGSDLQKYLDQAAAHGVKQFCGCWGPEQVKNMDEIRKTAAHFEKAAQLLAERGLDMCYHNHWWEFLPVDGKYAWDHLMALAPTLKAEIDIYWASNFGQVDVPAVVRQYAARTPLLHVKDGPLVKGEPNTAVGKGKMPQRPSVDAADPNVARYVIVELDRYVGGDQNTMEAVRDSYRYLVDSGIGRGRK